MNVQSLSGITVAVIALLIIIPRQLREKPVREERGMRGVLILAAIGIYEMALYVGKSWSHISTYALVFLLIGFVSACFFGWLRARGTHVWRDKGQLMVQGNWLTILWWVVALGIHLGIDYFASSVLKISGSDALATSSIVLYVALSLGVQKYVLLERGKEMREDESK